MNVEISPDFSIEGLLKKNKDFSEEYKKNPLMQLVSNGNLLNKKTEENLLDCIQVISNHFQKVVMLRDVFSEIPMFSKVAQDHLSEEFGHHISLMNDRKNRPCVWDAILESTTSWFIWKMFTLDNEEKTVLIHLVLETSGNLFFQKANKIIRYVATNYFKIHAEVDEKHEEMGKSLLENLSQSKYKRLFEVQKQGWDILNAACKRIAEISLN